MILSQTSTKLPLLIILIPESDQLSPKICNTISTSNNLEYESLLGRGRIDFEIRRPNDEWDPTSVLNYTSGTTSSPKGVIYNHRGAYLSSLATVLLNFCEGLEYFRAPAAIASKSKPKAASHSHNVQSLQNCLCPHNKRRLSIVNRNRWIYI
jgi:acyl-CoA synthetase (AMP-forming)/AMP-acid ligase II